MMVYAMIDSLDTINRWLLEEDDEWLEGFGVGLRWFGVGLRWFGVG